MVRARRTFRDMSFDVAAEAYDRFMGRYSAQLAGPFVERSGLSPGDRALDVGCGPGVLTGPLVELLGADHVAAIDPSEPFVAAARERFPDVDVRQGSAEQLPYDDGVFDAALAQLVVHFLQDPVAGVREMARVTKPGGHVLVSSWDHGGGRGPLSLFGRAAQSFLADPPPTDRRTGEVEGDLDRVATEAGLVEVWPFTLTVSVRYETFEDWWQPYTLGVGPAGDTVSGLDEAHRAAFADHLREQLPAPPFELPGTAWCVRGVVPQRGAPAAQ